MKQHAPIIMLLVLFVTLAGAPAAAQNGPSGDWLHFGCDSAYTAYNPAEHLITPKNVVTLELKWGIGCGDGAFNVISRSPAIVDGKLFVAPAGQALTAYDAVTGDKLWTYGQGNLAWSPAPAASADGLVFYLESGMNTMYDLYAVDANTGAQVWQAAIAFDLGYSNTNLVTVDEELVYFIESPFMPGAGQLFAFDQQTGSGVWFKGPATDKLIFRGDYPVLSGGKVYAASANADDYWTFSLTGIDTAGTIAQTFPNAGGPDRPAISRIAACGDTLLAVYVDRADSAESVGTVVAYDTASNHVLWQKAYDGKVGGLACNPDQNRVYVATDPFLFAFDAATGAEIWKYSSFGAVYNPSVANGVVYFLSATNMYAVDEETGQQLFFFRLGEAAEPTSQVAISNGMVYFSGNGGDCDLYALGLPE